MSVIKLSPELIVKIERAWPALIDAMVNGRRIDKVCAANGFSDVSLIRYRKQHPMAADEWDAARQVRAEYCVEQVMEIANSDMADSSGARRAEQYKWLAGKYNPKEYGDRSSLDVNVKTVDMTAIILEANKRLAAQREPVTIEGEVIKPQLSDIL